MAKAKPYPAGSQEIIDPEPLCVGALKSHLGLTTDELGAAAGRSARSAARWIAEETSVPTGGDTARSLRRLAHLEFMLADVIGAERGRTWLRTPNPGFRGEAPLDLITSGRLDEVLDVLELLADGGPV